MADISKLNLTGTDLDIKDNVARQKLTVVDPNEGEGLITFGVDANGNYGYKKVGADTVTPFLINSNNEKLSLVQITRNGNYNTSDDSIQTSYFGWTDGFINLFTNLDSTRCYNCYLSYNNGDYYQPRWVYVFSGRNIPYDELNTAMQEYNLSDIDISFAPSSYASYGVVYLKSKKDIDLFSEKVGYNPKHSIWLADQWLNYIDYSSIVTSATKIGYTSKASSADTSRILYNQSF